jgi:myo-inositol-1(or 4)-monophosphatase
VHPLLNIAIRAAREAGKVILRELDRVDALDVTTKGLNDYVSEVDRRAEQAVITTIRRSYPDHAVLGEESGLEGRSDHVWVIDPLDGTTNYLHGFPVFSVSIGVKYRGRVEHAVVFDPLRNELFTATRGSGAQLNSRRIRVTRRPGLEGALLGTGFPYRDLEHLDAYLAIFRDLLVRSAGIRRAGSAALDLAYVACGRLDGFWEFGLHEWDMAAGTLMIQEAGGAVTDVVGGDRFLASGNVVGGGLRVHGAILDAVMSVMAGHRLAPPPTPAAAPSAEAPREPGEPGQVEAEPPPRAAAPEPGPAPARRPRISRKPSAAPAGKAAEKAGPRKPVRVTTRRTGGPRKPGRS